MKPWQKIAMIVVTCFAAFSVIVILAVLSLLPSPETFGQWLGPRRARLAVESQTAPLQNMSSTSSAPADSVAADSSPTDIPSVASDTTTDRETRIAERFVERYLEDDRIQPRVCENLGNSSAPFRTRDEFRNQITASLLGETKPSSTAEAVMLPLEYTLKNDSVRELIEAARNAAERGRTGFIEKAQFYSLAAQATASVLSSRQGLEMISGHAYRLYAISRAAAMKPEILQDPDVSDLCRGLESAVDGRERDAAFDRERLGRILERHAIDPEKIDYDPNLTTQIQITNAEGVMQIKVPWLDRVFKK